LALGPDNVLGAHQLVAYGVQLWVHMPAVYCIDVLLGSIETRHQAVILQNSTDDHVLPGHHEVVDGRVSEVAYSGRIRVLP
jgi:hypothetical protein